MTRDTYQQSWYTGLVLITKLDHYFTVSANPKHFWVFEIMPNPRDTAPLIPLFCIRFVSRFVKITLI